MIWIKTGGKLHYENEYRPATDGNFSNLNVLSGNSCVPYLSIKPGEEKLK